MVIDRLVVPYNAPDTTALVTPQGPLGDADPSSQQAIANARNAFNANPPAGWAPAQAAASWQAQAKTVATAYCAARGYDRAVKVSSDREGEGWLNSLDRDGGSDYQYQAYKYRRWAATCQKTERRRR